MCVALYALIQQATAQQVNYIPFDAAPQVLNPSFSGMFDGSVRANAVYWNQWKSVTVPAITTGLSTDFPISVNKLHDYIGVGAQAFRSNIGDGYLTNASAALSLSFHKTLNGSAPKPFMAKELAFGVQGGYAQNTTNLSDIFFNQPGGYMPNILSLGIGSTVSNYYLNTGVSYSQSTGKRFNYTIGFSANNINQPMDAIEKRQNLMLGLGQNFSGTAGANWSIRKRLTLRPAVYYQVDQARDFIIAGNEFMYRVSKKDIAAKATSLFAALWYRTGDVATATVGVQHKAVKLGVSCERQMYSLNIAGNGTSAFQLTLKYTAPSLGVKLPKRTVPCSRF